MDYVNRWRIKIWGHAEFVEDDPALLKALSDPVYKAQPERALVFTVDAWDRNCPQRIQPRFIEVEMAPVVAKLQDRIAEVARFKAT